MGPDPSCLRHLKHNVKLVVDINVDTNANVSCEQGLD